MGGTPKTRSEIPLEEEDNLDPLFSYAKIQPRLILGQWSSTACNSPVAVLLLSWILPFTVSLQIMRKKRRNPHYRSSGKRE